jgi:acetylornithine deacetylase/succinyl-diaminopimelate desuccinylase-like protein
MSGADIPSVTELAQRLIRFDTSNPPGNERACIEYLVEVLRGARLETTVRSLDRERPNVLARLRGRGEQPPLLLHGHVDVVPTTGQHWRHDPFGGEIVDGELWGRGAIDMKGGLAMMLAAVLRINASETPPPGDVIFAALSDEEGGSSYGARFLVERHPELFAGVRHAIGEFGAVARSGRDGNVYLVPVAEKQWCSLRATIRGHGGHGALPLRGGAMARLAQAIAALDATRLPVHMCDVTAEMIDRYAEAVTPEQSEAIVGLRDPQRVDELLDGANGALNLFDAALHNTVNPTVVRAGERSDAIPDRIELELDGRVLPGQAPTGLLAELDAIPGIEAAFELTHVDKPPTASFDMSLLPALTRALGELDPGARVVPMLNPGVTDGRFFGELGIQHHGFLPMLLPDPAAIIQTMHGADERVATAALEFGANVYERLLRTPIAID